MSSTKDQNVSMNLKEYCERAIEVAVLKETIWDNDPTGLKYVYTAGEIVTVVGIDQYDIFVEVDFPISYMMMPNNIITQLETQAYNDLEAERAKVRMFKTKREPK